MCNLLQQRRLLKLPCWPSSAKVWSRHTLAILEELRVVSSSSTKIVASLVSALTNQNWIYNKAFKFAGVIAAWTAKNGRFLKNTRDPAGYSHDGCGFFYVCQNPQDVQPKEWALKQMQQIVLEKEMATHSSTLAWKIPWTDEHGRLQSALHGVAKSWPQLKDFTFTFHWIITQVIIIGGMVEGRGLLGLCFQMYIYIFFFFFYKLANFL